MHLSRFFKETYCQYILFYETLQYYKTSILNDEREKIYTKEIQSPYIGCFKSKISMHTIAYDGTVSL